MKKMITATLLGGAIVGSLLGAGAANATDSMLRVGSDIAVGDYQYTATGSYGGSYELCQTPRCEVGDDLIDIDVVSEGATGYLTITSDVKYVKLSGLSLTPM